MRAVRIDEPGELHVVDIDEPVVGEAEVSVDVAYAGICGSDVDLLAGRRPPGFVAYPVVPGHEWSGVVGAVGHGVDAALVGRRVVVEGFRSCGKCRPCRDGEPVLCESGYDEIGFTRQGAWAERVVVPISQVHCLTDNADLRAAAGLEPAACSAAAVEQASMVAGERAAVVGGGTIGLLAVQLLLALSPSEVLLVEPSERRRELARAWGATAIQPDDAEREFGHFDVVIEAAGATSTAGLAVDLARRGGRVVLAGIPDGRAALVVRDVVAKRLRIDTVFGAPQAAWQRAVHAFNDGVLDPGMLVTDEFAIDDAAAALGLVAAGDERTGKVLLHP